MPKQPDTPDLKKLEAQLLAERQAYYDRVSAQRSTSAGREQEHSEDQNLDAYLQERLDRLLGTPAR